MALDTTGNPVVAYTTGYVDAPISVLRWNNDRWSRLGWTAIGIVQDVASGPLSLALDAAGNPLVAFSDGDNVGKLTVMRLNGGTWSQVGGPGISEGGVDFLSLAIDLSGDPVVAYRDLANGGKTTVLRWNDDAGIWSPVGEAGISEGMASYQSLALDVNDDPVVAYRDEASESKTTVMRWNDGSGAWSALGGAGISEGSVSDLSLAVNAIGYPVVAYCDGANEYKTTVQHWNGTEWTYVGSPGFSAGSASYQSLVLDASGNPIVAYRDESNLGGTTVMRWNVSEWTIVGTPDLSTGWASNQGLALDPEGDPVVVYQELAAGSVESDDFRTTVMRWDGTNWRPVGAVGISTGNSESPSMVLDDNGHPLVAFADVPNSGITVIRWDGSDWSTVGDAGSAGDGSYPSLAWDPSGYPVLAYRDRANGNRTTVVRWNGSSWVAIGNVGISAGEASYQSLVLDPDGYPIVAYRDSVNDYRTTVMRWNGDDWTAMGGAGISAGGASQQSLALDTNGYPMVAYQDQVGGGYTVQLWNGINYWNALGDATGGLASRPGLAIGANGIPVVVFGGGLNCTIQVNEWVSGYWEPVGSSLAFISNPSHSLAMDPNGQYLVAYADFDNDNRATVKRWDGITWDIVGMSGFTASIAPAISGNWIKADAQGNLYVAYTSRSPDNTGGYLFVKWYEMNHVTTDVVDGPLCAGAQFVVPFSASGTFYDGNIFSVQLSDHQGSFAQPESIGSLVGVTGGSINATIPPGTLAGSGYRIRVVSSSPSIIGTDNGADITINVPGSGCDDSDICTINDELDANCVCVGTPDYTDTDSDGTANCSDNCPNVYGQQGDHCNDFIIGTINDTLGASCFCVGVYAADCEGTPGGTALPGSACDDGNGATVSDTWSISCECSGTLAMDCEGVSGGSAQPGTACNDNDACTMNDIYHANCDCSGTPMYVGPIFGAPLIHEGSPFSYTYSVPEIPGAGYEWLSQTGVLYDQSYGQDSSVARLYVENVGIEFDLCVTAQAFGCALDTCLHIQVIDVGIAGVGVSHASEFLVRPNPSDGRFELVCQSSALGRVNYVVEDPTGRSIGIAGSAFSASTMVDLGPVSPGVYLLRLSFDQRSNVIRLVVR